MQRILVKFQARPIIVGLLTFLFLMLIGGLLLWQRYQILQDAEKSNMENVLNVVEQNIEQSLTHSYSVALSMALLIDDEGEINNFEEVAPNLIQENSNISAVQMVPNGVITKVYPFEENKAVINYDILKDSTRSKEAFKAIESKQMYFAGPFELKQGGTAIVGRLPVFIKNEFWGFSAVLIKLETLLAHSGMDRLAGELYNIQFAKVDASTGEEVFYLQEQPREKAAFTNSILLPEGDWRVYISSKDPNKSFYILLPVAFMVLIIAFGLGLIMISLLLKPVRLQKLVEEQAGKIIESERNLRTIFNQAAIGMVRVKTESGLFMETNKRFQELTGYTKRELLKLDYKKLSLPEDVAINAARMQQLYSGEIREYSLQKKLIRKNGSFIWVKATITPLWEVGESPTYHISLVEDITEKMKAQEELVQSEKRFRALVENAGEVVTIYTREGKSLYFSPSIEKISGYSEREILGADLKRLVHPRDIKRLKSHMEVAIQNPGKPISGIVARTRNKSGEWRWTEATITNLLNDNAIGGFVGNFRDITHKKEAEINLNKSYQTVMDQNKRLLNFSYIVSHNLRSHSSNFESILNLYKITDDPEEHKTYLELLSQISSALNQTLYDLNDVVSIQTNLDLAVSSLSIRDYLEQTLGLVSVQIKKKKAIIIKDIPANMMVNYNPAYLESVLLNFITNALRYTDASRTPEIKILGYQERGQWVLEITDNGIGIDLERNGDKIFGLYKTFTKKANSRGVGLFLSKNQINAMGGKVSVSSKLGVGSTFKIFFK